MADLFDIAVARKLSGGSGGGGGGTTYTTLYDGSVTTLRVEYGTFSGGQIIAHPSGTDSTKVTFNGVEYIAPKVVLGGNYGYGAMSDGAPDFTEYPFFIAPIDDGSTCQVFTETEGTYTLKIEEPQSSGGGSSDFSTAQVTKIGEDVELYACCVDSEGSTTVSYSNPETVILYKGKAIVGIDGGTPLLDGAIEYDSDMGMWVITGDCTITIGTSGGGDI